VQRHALVLLFLGDEVILRLSPGRRAILAAKPPESAVKFSPRSCPFFSCTP
jgi:hypothetical protein